MIRSTILIVLVFFPCHFLTANTESIISKIQNNWNEIQTMSGEFSQLDSNGNLETGKFFFSKPYLSKFIYKNKKEDIVTNESLLRIVDKEGFQIDSYAIGGNILKKLLSNNLDIKKEFEINFIEETEKSYDIAAISKNSNSMSEVILTFNKTTIELEKWEISDEIGNKTVLQFTKVKKNIFISDNLFDVRYQNN